jgi:hypothetical protein
MGDLGRRLFLKALGIVSTTAPAGAEELKTRFGDGSTAQTPGTDYSPADVVRELNVQQRNADGGHSFSLDVTPSVPWAGPFGGSWQVQHRFASNGRQPHVGASYGTAAFVRQAAGSGKNGPANGDYAAFFSSVKTSHTQSAIDGEIDVICLTGRQGRKDDLGGVLVDLEKVGGDTGGVTGSEIAVKWIDGKGAVVTRQHTVTNLAGQTTGFYGVNGVSGIGYFTEIRNGAHFAAFLADQVGKDAVYQHLLYYTEGRSVANKIFGIDGAGRIEASASATPSHVAYGFVSDPDTGLRRSSADVMGVVTGGIDRWSFDNKGRLLPSTDNAYDIGALSTHRLKDLFMANAPTIASDRRQKIEQPFALGLDFLLMLNPKAYLLRNAKVDFGTVEREVEVEEIETEEKMVTVEEAEFDGTRYIMKSRQQLQPIPVYGDPIPVLNEDGTQAVERVTEQEIDKDGRSVFEIVLSADGRPETRPKMKITERPIFISRPRTRKVMKRVEQQVAAESAGKRTHYGFFAQEVKQALDQINQARTATGLPAAEFAGWVKADPSDPESNEALRYEEFTAIIVKAAQELNERLVAIETRMAALEQRSGI